MGGEACAPELAARLVAPGREVWNTYGPTEATVVACGAELTGEAPVRIGLPLDGWDLAVVDADGHPVPEGATGELIIGGVGLARYLDPEKDAEKYAPMPTLGWERAYRSGDLVVNDPAGLLFGGRADDQVKLGGRRIELGEIDSALLALPGVNGAAAAVRRTGAGNSLLVGYVAVDDTFDQGAALATLRAAMPAALVPRLAVVDAVPTRTSGKVDRDALPWPLPRTVEPAAAGLGETETWLAELWLEILAASVETREADFFDLGGGSLTAAQLVSLLRVPLSGGRRRRPLRAPDARCPGRPPRGDGRRRSRGPAQRPPHPAEDPDRPGGRDGAGALPRGAALGVLGRSRRPGARRARRTRLAARHPAGRCSRCSGALFVLPPGRMVVAAAAARILLRGVTPGDHPRGGKTHLRLWLATHVADELGATSLAGAPLRSPGTPACWEPRSAATSTSTRCPRSPACSGSARAARSSPRST